LGIYKYQSYHEIFENLEKVKSDKNLIFADVVYFGFIYPSEKKRENSNRGKSCPPRFVKGFCILYLL
jgi:hypothetical protein